MELKEIKLSVPKEVLDVGDCLKAVLVKVAAQKKDGWSNAEDIPAVVLSSIAAFMAAVDKCQEIPQDFSEKPYSSSLAILIPVLEGIEELLKK